MGSNILLIEDDESIGSGLTDALEARGHAVTWHRTGREGVAAHREGDFQLALLDLGLPDLDGVAVCRLLRVADPGLAILMLTARSEEADVVVGLNAGADDYISKPFGLGELVARIEAQERRRERSAGQAAGARMRAGALELDPAARRVTLHGDDVALTTKEFDLLALLLRERGRVVTREQIIDTVWDTQWAGPTKTLDMHILTLRRKLAGEADTPGAPEAAAVPRITTLRGVGYRLDSR